MLSHFASAALAMVCAIASEMFFWVTTPCAWTGNDSAIAPARATSSFPSDMMNLPDNGAMAP